MIISVGVENAFVRINYFSMMKTINSLGTEENDFSIIKGVCEGAWRAQRSVRLLIPGS